MTEHNTPPAQSASSSTPARDQPSSPSSTDAAQRIAILIGDRFCTRCAYNLVGQSVLREPHYNMLIVRCPECATVASVQEYPLLGRWANRWATALAGLWIVLLLTFWLANGLAVFGLSLATATMAGEKFHLFLAQEYSAYITSIQNTGGSSSASSASAVPFRSAPSGFSNWWNQQSKELISKASQHNMFVQWRAFWLWLPLGLASFGGGCFWAAAMLHLRWRGRMLLGVTVIAAACCLSMIPILDWHTSNLGWYSEVVGQVISTPVLVLSLAFAAVMLSMGLVFGRIVVRSLLRIMLPPRLCSALAALWIADGLEPPRPLVKTLRVP